MPYVGGPTTLFVIWLHINRAQSRRLLAQHLATWCPTTLTPSGPFMASTYIVGLVVHELATRHEPTLIYAYSTIYYTHK